MCEAIRQEARLSKQPLTEENADQISDTQIWYQPLFGNGSRFGRISSLSLLRFYQVGDRHKHELEVCFSLYVQEDCPTLVAQALSGRLLHPRPDSDPCSSLIQSWMDECLNKHGGSCPHDPKATLPTRLLDVETVDGSPKSSLCLVEPQNVGEWVTLSHCWGHGPHFATISENLAPRQRSILFEELPRTFQDAVTVTRRLGFRYLWIDSLCIIQDDHQDWAREAARMHIYYKNAILTIAADSAISDREGFLETQRWNEPALADLSLTVDGLTYPANWGPPLTLRGCPDRVFVRKLPKAVEEPLDKRAWTLQENILSPRTIHYTSQGLKWECQTCISFESDLNPSSFPHITISKKQDFLNPVSSLANRSSSSLGEDDIFDDPYDRWYPILEDYCTRALTIPSDMLPAISGIAREVNKHTGSRYAAGLWLEDIYRGLLWCYYGRGRPPKTYRAPSWSWASLDAIQPQIPGAHHNLYDEFSIDEMINNKPDANDVKAEVLDCDVTARDKDPYGEVIAASIIIRGFWLSPVQWKTIRSNRIDIWAAPPYLNRYDRTFVSGMYPLELTGENPVICSFDEFHSGNDADELFHNVSLLQIACWEVTMVNSPCKGRRFALLLRPQGESGEFKRVGIAELPYSYNQFERDNWEMRDVAII